LSDQTFDRKQLDKLVLFPHGKLAALRYHLQQDSTPSHLRADVVGGQIDIDAAISAYMAQIHLLLQAGQPGIRVNPFWKRG
jgi:hypothetical protein